MVKKTKEPVNQVEDEDDFSIEQLIEQAAADEDQSDVSSGGFERELAPAGVTVGRLIEYIELGLHPQKPFKGQAKPACEEVNLVFELLSPKKNIHEVTKDDGEKFTYADKLFVNNFPKKLNEKAKYYKLFDAMRGEDKTITHMAQMLGKPFIINVQHSVPKKAGDKVYIGLFDKGLPKIEPAARPDPITGEMVHLNVPEALSDRRIFLYDRPTQKTWDKLFIDGTYTKDGTEHSKNFLQEKIMRALNFEGSGLQTLLGGVAGLPNLTEEVEAVETTEDVAETDAGSEVVEEAEADNTEVQAEAEPELPVETPAPVAAKPKINTNALTKPAAPKAAPAKAVAPAVAKKPVVAATKPAPVAASQPVKATAPAKPSTKPSATPAVIAKPAAATKPTAPKTPAKTVTDAFADLGLDL